jgi:hypothetical protein
LRSCVTSIRPCCAANSSTFKSLKPCNSAAEAVWKFIAGSRRSTPVTLPG